MTQLPETFARGLGVSAPEEVVVAQTGDDRFGSRGGRVLDVGDEPVLSSVGVRSAVKFRGGDEESGFSDRRAGFKDRLAAFVGGKLYVHFAKIGSDCGISELDRMCRF